MDYVYSGTLTEAGKELIAFIESHFLTDDGKVRDDVDLNSLSGTIKHYYANVRSGFMTRESWVQDYPNAAAALARNMEQAKEAQAQQESVREVAARSSELEAKLSLIQERMETELAAMKAENAALREALEQKGKGKGKKTEVAEDAQSEE